MKKEALVVLFLMLISFASATCSLETSLVNQDPYPAIPGDYVKLVFQVDGVDNSDCGRVSLEFIDLYPFSLDKEERREYSVDSFFERKYSSYLIAPFKVRVDSEALNGENSLEVLIKYGATTLTKEFDINVKDSRTDFDIFVKDYDMTTKKITFEVLNIGENDVEAITLTIPKQGNIDVKGANTNIIGDLDSNEYTTADFEIASANGEFNIDITYSDSTNVRRSLTKQVVFDKSYFEGRNGDSKTPWGFYVFILILLVAGWYGYKKYKHYKKLKEKRE